MIELTDAAPALPAVTISRRRSVAVRALPDRVTRNAVFVVMIVPASLLLSPEVILEVGMVAPVASVVAVPVEEYPRPSADVSSSNVCGNALPAAGFALKLSITVTIAATPVPRRQLLLLSASVTTSLVSELADAELSHATKPPSKRTLVVVAAAYIACCAVIVIVDPATIEPREALVNANCTLSGELLAFAEPANADTHPGCVVSPVVYAV